MSLVDLQACRLAGLAWPISLRAYDFDDTHTQKKKEKFGLVFWFWASGWPVPASVAFIQFSSICSCLEEKDYGRRSMTLQ